MRVALWIDLGLLYYSRFPRAFQPAADRGAHEHLRREMVEAAKKFNKWKHAEEGSWKDKFFPTKS